MTRYLAVAALASLIAMSSTPAEPARVPLRIVHVCIDQPNGARDIVKVATHERPAAIPGPALARSIGGALQGMARQRGSIDLLLAALAVRFIAPEPVWMPRTPAPAWDEDDPRQPRGYDCVCGRATFRADKSLAGCTLDECDGSCVVCVAR